MVPVVLAFPNVRINAVTAGSSSAIMLAAMNGLLLGTKTLIAHGADLSVTNEQGRTALDVAVRNGRAETGVHTRGGCCVSIVC
jgi:ankyrin repeat protein